MEQSLIFNENSLSAEFISSPNTSSFYIVFTVTDTGIINITEYLEGLEINSIVAFFSLMNPYGGALINGSLYYTNSDPIQFTSDTTNINSSDTIGIVLLNFAYLGDMRNLIILFL